MKINAPVSDAKQPQEPPESARDTIRAAIEEHKEAAEDQKKLEAQEEKKEPDKVEAPKEPDKVEAPKEPDKKEEKVEVETSSEKKEEKKEDEEPKEPKAPKTKAPFGLPKNVRAKWETADPELQEFVAKTVKENLDNKANQGRKAYLGEVDQVLTPYMPQLQQLGATPAQLVKRLLEYSDALSGEKTKYLAIAKLAQDFGVDLTVFNRQAQPDNNTEQLDAPVDTIPPELNAKLDYIINRFSQTETAQKSDNDRAAEQTINQWAGFDSTTQEFKNKPYFPYVRQTMHSLLASGTIPLVDGRIDLDAAYESACYMHPEIREHLLEDQARAVQEREAKKQEQKAAVITRTKNAASSIRPGAPAPQLPVTTKNGSGQQLSVRDALKLAIAEARESRA